MDPDQDDSKYSTTETLNAITGLGRHAAVSATGPVSGYTVTLGNTTGDLGFSVAGYIDNNCCLVVDPAYALTWGQGLGFNTLNDGSISLAYDLGALPSDQSASFSYAYTMSVVPEPETYAIPFAGLGLVGFMARRRRII